MTVAESFENLPHGYRGLVVPTRTGESAAAFLPCPLVIHYEIVGSESEVWQVVADHKECTVGRGTGLLPFTVIRLAAADWLALWSRQVSIWRLLHSERITFTPEDEGVLCLPYLGLLGPAVPAPREALWLLLHGVPRWRLGYFVSGALPDVELFQHWENRTTPNVRVLAAAAIIVGALLWWLAGTGVAVAGALAMVLVLCSVAWHLAEKAARDPVTFRWSLVPGIVTVRPRDLK